MLKISKTQIGTIVLALFAIVILSMIGRIGEDVKNETIVVNQYPFTGKMAYWTTPGWRGQWFGKTTTYFKTNQIWFDKIEYDNSGNPTNRSVENGAFPITYADKGKGFVLGSVRIELPIDQEHLSLIQQHYGDEQRLYDELIKPTIGKVILATGPLMTSLESVSEKRNDLIAYATDQLNGGIYQTKAITVTRTNIITNEEEKITQAEIVKDENNKPIRNEESPFSKYGLKVSQLAITDLVYETATNNQISKQREAEMDIITAKAEAAKAQQQTIKNEEEGKQAAAAAKWKEEANKAAAVTIAEKEREVSRLAAEKAEFDKRRIIAEGQAEAEANRLKVAAGLSPQEKAEWDFKTKVGVAEAISKVELPKVVATTGSGNGSSTGMEAVGLNMLLQMADKLSK